MDRPKLSFKNNQQQLNNDSILSCSPSDCTCAICRDIFEPGTNTDDIMKIKLKHLRSFLNTAQVSINTCKDKRDLAELVIRIRSEFRNKINKGMDSTNSRKMPSSSTSYNPSRMHMSDTKTNNNPLTSSLTTSSSSCYSFLPNFSSVFNFNAQKPLNIQQQTYKTPSSSAADSAGNKRQKENSRQQTEIPQSSHTSLFSTLNSQERHNSTISPLYWPSPNSLKHRASISDIKADTDLNTFNLKQIKEILESHSIKYNDCCEKAELVERLKNLYKYNLENKSKKQALINGSATFEQIATPASSSTDANDERDTCIICMESSIDCVLLECGHMCLCLKCGETIKDCPICRKKVVKCIKIYKS